MNYESGHEFQTREQGSSSEQDPPGRITVWLTLLEPATFSSTGQNQTRQTVVLAPAEGCSQGAPQQ